MDFLHIFSLISIFPNCTSFKGDASLGLAVATDADRRR